MLTLLALPGFGHTADPITPKIKPSKETTYVDGPLDKNGYVDYEKALNLRLKGTMKPEENALVLLIEKCYGPKPEGANLIPEFYEEIGMKAPPEQGDYLISESKYFAEDYRTDSESIGKMMTRLRSAPWKPQDAPKHAEWLKKNEKPLAAVLEAVNRPRYYHPLVSQRTKKDEPGMLIGVLLPSVQKSREIASLLSVRVMYHLGQGNLAAAQADAIAMHKLGRLVGQGGTLIELLVGIAIDSIACNSDLALLEQGNLTTEQLLAYQKILRELPDFTPVAEKVNEGERFMCLDAIQGMMRNQDMAWAGKEFNNLIPQEMKASLDWEIILKICNGWYTRLVKVLSEQDFPKRQEAVKKIEQELQDLKSKGSLGDNYLKRLAVRADPEKYRTAISENIGNVLIGLLIPAVSKVGEAELRARQNLDIVLLATALQAYQKEMKQYPEKLTDLSPKFITTLPRDRFNGKALIYRKTERGYLLYSVGVNGKDDAGSLITDPFPESGTRGDDIGTRVPRQR
jgi:hypothetical protein